MIDPGEVPLVVVLGILAKEAVEEVWNLGEGYGDTRLERVSTSDAHA